jgi:hypothetical protein
MRGLGLVVGLALGLGAVFVALVWRPAHDSARIEAARAARQACSCRYLGGRALGDCEKDNPKGRFPSRWPRMRAHTLSPPPCRWPPRKPPPIAKAGAASCSPGGIE